MKGLRALHTPVSVGSQQTAEGFSDPGIVSLVKAKGDLLQK
jgi:hypothetical protein